MRFLRVFGLAALLFTSCSPKELSRHAFFTPGEADLAGLLAIVNSDGSLVDPKKRKGVPRTKGPFFTAEDIETIEAKRVKDGVDLTIHFKRESWKRLREDSYRFIAFDRTYAAFARDGKMIAERRIEEPVDASLSLPASEAAAIRLLAGLVEAPKPDLEKRGFERVEFLKEHLLIHYEDVHALAALAKGLSARGDGPNALAAFEELYARASFAKGAAIGKAEAIAALGAEYAKAKEYEWGIKFLRAAYDEIGEDLATGKIPRSGGFAARAAARAAVLRLYNGAGEADHAMKLSTQFLRETREEAERYGIAPQVRDRALAGLENL
jgi:hypothetical protein